LLVQYMLWQASIVSMAKHTITKTTPYNSLETLVLWR